MNGSLSDQLSPHFKRKEFACKCGCGFADVDIRLVEALEKLRTILGNKPILITSGCRCQAHNRKIGGASNSYHVQGKAVDIKASSVTVDSLHAAAEKISEFANGGIGRYKAHIHVDIGPKRRW